MFKLCGGIATLILLFHDCPVSGILGPCMSVYDGTWIILSILALFMVFAGLDDLLKSSK